MPHPRNGDRYLPGAPTNPSNGFTAALSRNELFSGMSLNRIADVLEPGETVLLALPAVASDTPKVLMVTNHRVVLAKIKGLLSRARVLRSEPPARVRGIRFRGRVLSLLTVRIDGARNIRLMPHRAKDASRFTEEFEQLIRTGQMPV